jgi:hypothetical protein
MQNLGLVKYIRTLWKIGYAAPERHASERGSLASLASWEAFDDLSLALCARVRAGPLYHPYFRDCLSVKPGIGHCVVNGSNVLAAFSH